MASVYSMRAKLDATNASSRLTASLSIRSAKNAMSSARSSRTARKLYRSRSSARSALALMSANAISGSTIQNSERCLLVFEFSARNVGPNV